MRRMSRKTADCIAAGHAVYKVIVPSSGRFYYRCRNCENVNRNRHNPIAGKIPPCPSSCDFCGLPGIALVRDHCHKTLLFRGWVHRSCNFVIAKIEAVGISKIDLYLTPPWDRIFVRDEHGGYFVNSWARTLPDNGTQPPSQDIGNG